jgi:hypothetical protein
LEEAAGKPFEPPANPFYGLRFTEMAPLSLTGGWIYEQVAPVKYIKEKPMLSLANFNTATGKLEANYKGPAKAIPWANIISLLMSLIAGCIPAPPTPPKLKQAVSTDNLYLEYAVRTELRASHGLGAWRTYDGPGVCEAIKKTIAESDDAFLQGCLDDAAA